MSYWLGIDVGTTFTAAAICRQEAGRPGVPEVVALGTRSTAVSSVVYLAPDGQVVVGEAAERRAVTDPDRVVREFKRRIGDEVPMVIGGRAHSAPEITALVLGWVIERVAAREGGPAVGIVVTHPAGWGPYKISTVTAALGAAGLASVAFRTEPEAAAASYAAARRIESGTTIAVYDLGGGTFDAAVVRKTGAATLRVLGVPQGLEDLGGADFDDAIMRHVLAAVPALAELDPEDPATLAATAVLRRECTEAKEALSSDTEVTIPVLAPGVQSRVRLVRAEFEDMIRPQVVLTVEALRRALRSADVEPDDLDAVVLVGGSSRVPLVAQLISAGLGRPVAIDADPKAAIALGAALCALPTVDVDVASPTPVPVPEIPARDRMEAPQRPSLTAIPLDVVPASLVGHRTRSRLVKRVAVAGALSLLAAGGVAAVPFLTSQADPVPQVAAGTPASAPASPPASAPSSSGNSPDSGGTGGAVVAGPVTASTKPASAAAKPAAVRAQPAGLRTVGAHSPIQPNPSGTTPAPSRTTAPSGGGGTSTPIGDPAPAPGTTPTTGSGTGTTPTGGDTGTTPPGGGTGTGPTGGGATGGSPTGGGGTPTGGGGDGTGTTPTGGGGAPTGGGTPAGGGTTPTGGGTGTTPTAYAPPAQHT